MKAAPKPCTQCGVLVRDGTARCAAHTAAAWGDAHRESRHARGYGSAWDRLRGQIMRRDGGLCRCDDCEREGTILPAHEVDHKVGKAEWKRLHGTLDGVDDPRNLRAINRGCHSHKTTNEARAARGLQPLPRPAPGQGGAKRLGGPAPRT
ncbi:MAG: hypothetical protein RIQ53_4206, partial [Pseudomonadota bacterium]